MNKEKYLARIKKLLNKARNNSSPEEASVALKMAQALMREHSLTETDVLLTDIIEFSSKGAPSDAQQPPEYMMMLTGVINRAFGVKCYFTWRYTHLRGVPVRCVMFYGPAERPQIAAYAFDVLSRQLTRARREYIATQQKRLKAATRTARADLFCKGWVLGVYQAVTHFAVTEPEQTLMAAYRQKIVDNREMKDLSARKARDVRGGDDAAQAGFLAGQQVTLNHGVTGTATCPPAALTEGTSC
jgi:hypothetical protein